jgi:hypothetical protein
MNQHSVGVSHTESIPIPPLLEIGKERTLQMPNEVDEHVLNPLCVDRHQLAQQPHKL